MLILGIIIIIVSLYLLYLKYRVVFTGEKCKGKIIGIVDQNAGYVVGGISVKKHAYIIETNYPAFTVPRGFKCRNNREINDIHTNLITSIYCSKPSSITSPVESKRTELRALR